MYHATAGPGTMLDAHTPATANTVGHWQINAIFAKQKQTGEQEKPSPNKQANKQTKPLMYSEQAKLPKTEA